MPRAPLARRILAGREWAQRQRLVAAGAIGALPDPGTPALVDTGGQLGSADGPQPHDDYERIPAEVPTVAPSWYHLLHTRLDELGRNVVNTAAGGRVFPNQQGWPTSTTAGADTAFPFPIPVRHLVVQNNGTATVYVDFDAQASTSSLQIPIGSVLSLDVRLQELHIYCSIALAVNSAVGASGVYVAGFE